MPLDPKQQPPYYTPGTTPTPPGANGNYTRIYTSFGTNQTSGTSETDIYTFTLPANSLNTIGDSLLIEYLAITNTGSNSHITRFYFDTVQQLAYDYTVENYLKWLLKITRNTNTSVLIDIIPIQQGNYQIQTEQQETVDFTNTIPLKITGQCPTAGYIQAYYITIDKIIQ